MGSLPRALASRRPLLSVESCQEGLDSQFVFSAPSESFILFSQQFVYFWIAKKRKSTKNKQTNEQKKLAGTVPLFFFVS